MLIPSLEIYSTHGPADKISGVGRSLLVQKDAQKLYVFSNACALLDPEHKENVCILDQF